MKLLFSEAGVDYKNYIFSYAIWAVPEGNESPHLFFAKGFLPSSRDLDRYYLCRSVRIPLHGIAPSSENRRILRKGTRISHRLITKDQFEFDRTWQEFCLTYADIKFGKNIMSEERLHNLIESRLTTHFLIFHDEQAQKDVGLVTLFLQPPFVAQYYYAFYDLSYYRRNLGMYMMTSAVFFFAEEKFDYLHLGTCYSRNALYKTQFTGAEFFNGVCWSTNLKELKHLISGSELTPKAHLLESDFVHKFYDGDLSQLVEDSIFRISTTST